ncbi:MAG: T9SS type A sorting domain-containing protein [Lewinella sp.]|nr:T9SS type A sorting domain-containing protein [Lewinella sp.]
MKTFIFTLTFFCLFIQTALSQSIECGATVSEAHLKVMEAHRESLIAFEQTRNGNGRSGGILWVPIQLHDLRSVYYSGIAEYTKGYMMNELNSHFLPYQIQFFECGLMDIVVDANLADFDMSQRAQLLPYLTSNVINVFFVDDLTDGAASYCGWGDLPDLDASDDLVLVRKGGACMPDYDVFLHEIGHFLNLYHTHHAYNGLGELVDGSNCSVAGDLVCDTPADPNLYGLSLNNCQYTGSATDLNNQVYQPDATNLMSYASFSCRNAFTPGQMSRMEYCIRYIRNLNGCSHPYACDNPINSFPYTEDFENGLGGWTPLESNDFPVIPMVVTNTPLMNNVPGPATAQSGNYFVQPDIVNYGNGAYFGLISPCIDLSSMVNPELSLWYYLDPDAQSVFAVQYSTDGGQTIQHFNPQVMLNTSSSGWQQITIDLTSFVNSPLFQIRIAGSMMTNFQGVDNIQIRDTYVAPCTLTTVYYQSDPLCYGDHSGIIAVDLTGPYTSPVSFQWSNGSTDPSIQGVAAGTYTVTITDGNNCTAVATYTITEPDELILSVSSTDATAGNNDGSISAAISGGVSPYQYAWSNGSLASAIFNLSPGLYGLTVTDANGCTTYADVNINTLVQCDATYTNFPYDDSFESGMGIFTQETSLDDENWRRRSGSTPTSNTGPSGAHSGTYYRYIEASSNRNRPGKVAILKTKRCLDLTLLDQPVFELYYNLYGAQMGSLEIQVSIDDETSWTTAFSISGDQGNQWSKLSVDLSPWQTDHTKLRIVGTTGSGGRSDIAIDDYYLGESGSNSANPYPLEAALRPIAVPAEIRAYPNPATNRLYVELPDQLLGESSVQLTLFALSGEKVMDQRLATDQRIELSVGDLSPGYYFLQLSNASAVSRAKIIIAGIR